MRTTHKRFIGGVAAAALLAFPLAACGSDDDSTSSSSSSESSAPAKAPEPVASIDALTGESTAIALDQGFVDALTTLKLTPGVTGDAKLTDGSLIFPITGGNVSVFEPGSVPNYVVGQIQHENSGLSLTAGDTKVELTNFNVDPGVSRVYGDVSVNGKTVVTSAFLFNLDGSTLEPLKTEGTNAILTGTQVQISDVAAPLLNDTFKTDAVKPGLLVGIATITVATK
ncbi:hypothetical protein [Nocardioides sp. 503]|uniref:hypothetical protein n=1 Tax=Nocardioides sp. 503 TaxID=2508326 RepID=UPI00106F4201|nr:hypothetical protein [Nocardioides sp. 503]